jgi:hypothetical protein
MEAYADYAYYTQRYGGRAVAEGDFTRLSGRATAYLRAVTGGRLEQAQPFPQAALDACCAVAEAMQALARGELAGVSVDGYSESYVKSGLSARQLLRAAAFPYLADYLSAWA